MARYVVGVTGGVASGKSAVTALFAGLGIKVADADLAAREVVSAGSPALQEIQQRFGTDILLADGALDRAKLRSAIFADAQARADLEAITHPRIRKIIRDQCVAAQGPYVIAAIPLLAESGVRSAYAWLQRILVVDAPVAVQRARLMLRDGISLELAERMIHAQASREQRLGLATDVIVNDGPMDGLPAAVERLDALFRRLAVSQ